MDWRQGILGTSLALAGGWLALGPGMRSLMLHEWGSAFDLSVRVHGTAQHDLRGRMELQSLELNSQQQPENSIQVERFLGVYSPADFLCRRVSFKAASLQGTHYQPRPEPSTILTRLDTEAQLAHQKDWFPDSLLGTTGDRIYRELESESRLDVESQKSEAMWLTQLEKLEAERFTIESQLNALPNLGREGANPLRDQVVAKEASEKARQLGDRLVKLQYQKEQLALQYKEDRLALLQSKRKTLVSKSEERLAGSLDSHAIAQSMLIEMTRSVLTRLNEFAAVGGFPIPRPDTSQSSLLSPANGSPKRGTMILTTTKAEKSPFFLGKAKWNGDVRIGDRLYAMEGRVSDLAAGDPTSNAPTHSVCLLRCDQEEILVRSNLAIDVEAGTPKLEISSDQLALSAWQFTNQQGMRIMCQGEPLQVYLILRKEESTDHLQLTISQKHAKFELRSAQGQAAARLADQMTQSLMAVEEWHCHAEVHGSPETDSNWHIDSNLLDVLQKGLHEAIKSEIAMQSKQIDAICVQAIGRIESTLDQQASSRVATFDRHLGQLNQRIASYSSQISPIARRESTIRTATLPSDTVR